MRIDTEFVLVKTKGILKINPESYREIILEYAEKGYLYKGYIPLRNKTGILPKKVELIFQKLTN